ncbi:MAG: GNAT family N-acetyltransferase [Betaproteobacteria bacterium]
MGSVQVFPRSHGAGTIADVWRAGPVPGSGLIRVRETRLEDYAALRALQRVAAPYLPTWTLKQLESQRHAFAEGQMVAVCEGQVVGVASSLVLHWDDYSAQPTWRSITAEGSFTTHDPHGGTLYGADLVVDWTRRGFGVSRALFQARRKLCRRLNLKRIIATARLPGYHAVREALSPEQYAMRVVWGDIADPAMRFLMAQGFQHCGILHDYLPDDADSCGHAALFAWLNPLYAPPGPTATAEAQRQRKCA